MLFYQKSAKFDYFESCIEELNLLKERRKFWLCELAFRPEFRFRFWTLWNFFWSFRWIRIIRNENIWLHFPANKCFWPVSVWRSNFGKTYNLKFNKNSGTRFSRNGYIAQAVPALMMTHALRYAFDIPGGEGRIENADETMVYSFNSANRSWGIWVSSWAFHDHIRTHTTQVC